MVETRRPLKIIAQKLSLSKISFRKTFCSYLSAARYFLQRILLLMKKLFSISFIIFSLTSHANAYYMDYLGGAYNLQHCTSIAGQLGYPKCQYGGYYNGYYVLNGCFGIYYQTPPPAPSSSCNKYNIETYSWSLKQSTSYLKIWMNKSAYKDIYYNAILLTDNLTQVSGELEQIAKDKGSCRFISEFFLDQVRKHYEGLKKDFLYAHNQALDPKVGDAWQKLDQDYRKLRSQMR